MKHRKIFYILGSLLMLISTLMLASAETTFYDTPDFFIYSNPVVAPTCTDGIMNGQETGIDCGGICPYACSGSIIGGGGGGGAGPTYPGDNSTNTTNATKPSSNQTLGEKTKEVFDGIVQNKTYSLIFASVIGLIVLFFLIILLYRRKDKE